MSWAKIDDQFPDHPKILAVGPLAAWLFVCGLCYCARLLTDGFIPRGQIRRLADVDNAPELADRLVECGLWEVCEGGWRIHDYLDYNPSRERTLATREARASAGSKGGKQKSSNLPETCLPPATPVACTFPKQNRTPYPYPNPLYIDN